MSATQGTPHRNMPQKGCSSGERASVNAHTRASSDTAQSTSATHVHQHNLLVTALTAMNSLEICHGGAES